ncbi:MAG: NCS2 family permease [Fusobacterium sp.]|uniref:NCS2 family permease n=1 Tax=Fusobacterium sp. TaxID=68766 RepID=UPI0026DB6B60|nr:NCS2 family permease [Fusobacterium sp.]MDO4690015.1 NCS2 family permease [Fusobacterium sp.]
MEALIKSYFKINDFGTDIRKEIIAGTTNFLTMAYILGVNTIILSSTGMNFNSVFLATAISSAIACFVMGLYANAPLGLAPGMGSNSFFAFIVVKLYGYSYQEALAMVFLSGSFFILLSLTGIRDKIINSIPKNLKQSIGAGTGFFIALIGLVKAGIVVPSSATIVTLGNLKNPTVLLAIFGFLLTIIFMSRKIEAAVFLGLLITGFVGIILGKFGVEGMPTFSNEIIKLNNNLNHLGEFSEGLKSLINKPKAIFLIFTFFFVDFFDTAGTLVAITNKIESTVDKKYEMKKMLFSDAVGTVIGSILGTSTITTLTESTSGVAAGGRTGLTAIVTGIWFLISWVFTPLVTIASPIAIDGRLLEPIIAPSLICVGILMVTQLSKIDWDDFSSAASGFVTIIIMILSYSIPDGIAAGLIVYVFSKILTKDVKDVKISVWLMFILFLLHFILK